MEPPILVSMSVEIEPPKQPTGLVGSMSLDGNLLVRTETAQHQRNGNDGMRRALSAPPPSEEPVPPPTSTFSRSHTSCSLPVEEEPFEDLIEQPPKSMSHDNMKPLVRRGAIRHKRVANNVVRRPLSAPQAPVLSTPGKLKIRPLKTRPTQSNSNVVSADNFGQAPWWTPLDHLLLPSCTKMFSFKAKDIAVELTLIDAEMFRCITPSEIKDSAWTKAETKVSKVVEI